MPLLPLTAAPQLEQCPRHCSALQDPMTPPWEGWLGHRHAVAQLSLPVPACSQGMSLLIHALLLIAIYGVAPSSLNWGRKVVALVPLGHGQGQEGAQPRGCRERAGSSSQDGVEDRCS